MRASSENLLAIHFGLNLRACRRRAGLSQDELGRRSSLHRTEIGLLERGIREPMLGTVLKLAGALGASLDDLVAAEWKPDSLMPGGFELRR